MTGITKEIARQREAKADLASLIARLEAASELSRDLFSDVLWAAYPNGGQLTFPTSWISDGAWESAALAIVREMLPGCEWSIEKSPREQVHRARVSGWGAKHTHPAIALLIAGLNARSAQCPTPNN